MNFHKRILLFFLTIMCLPVLGCTDTPDGAETPGADEKGEEAQTIFDTGPLRFECVAADGKTELRRGEYYQIFVSITNASAQPYVYMGLGEQPIHFDTWVEVYCETEDGSYRNCSPEFIPDAAPEEIIFPSGERSEAQYGALITDDAPLGAYDVLVAFDGYHQIFYDVFTVIKD